MKYARKHRNADQMKGKKKYDTNRKRKKILLHKREKKSNPNRFTVNIVAECGGFSCIYSTFMNIVYSCVFCFIPCSCDMLFLLISFLVCLMLWFIFFSLVECFTFVKSIYSFIVKEFFSSCIWINYLFIIYLGILYQKILLFLSLFS